MSSRDYDRYGPSKQRSRSRPDAFLDALEGGHMRSAFETLNPSSQATTDGHRHHHRHHTTRGYDYHNEGVPRRNGSRYEDDYPRESYYHESDAPPRRHRSVHYEDDEDDSRRVRSYERGGHGTNPHDYRHHRHHDHHDHHDHHERRASFSAHGGGVGSPDLRQAASAAATAGVVEAWRARHDADKAMRVATAALGAAATDSALGTQRDRKGKRHVAESALAGLVQNRVINGPRR
ncbi:hypothetical protein F5Y19DRAFT_489220 [Xylariaceae sp. FL1651]|nr:hypothetical protein F5Y19DRAFT_489220 [Xylariaceae sp. FL1651]